MGPFRHCHRNAYEGFVQSFVFLVSAASIFNRRFLLGDSPHNLRFFSIVARTLKTAHPNFNHLALDQFHQFSLWSHLFSILLDQVLDRLVSASFYVTAFTPLTYHLVVFQGSYFFRMGYLFLRWASRLDAFSVYPVRISLPSCALGRTTVAPVMRSLRSSRTRSNSSHVSFAHDG